MKTVTHILVIRLSALGDVAMTVPVLRVVRQTYPTLAITIVSRGFYRPMFKDIPNVSFIEADIYGTHKGIGLYKLAEEIMAHNIHAVADLHNVIRSKLLTTYLRIRGIHVATIDKGRSEKKALTRPGKKEFHPVKTTHQRYADVFEALGFPIDLQQHQFPPRIELSPKMLEINGKDHKKTIGIAPFAAYRSKMYPYELTEEVIRRLDETQQYRIFLFGGGEEEINFLKGTEKGLKTVTAISGLLTFEEELAFISNLDLMLSMDSGNGHLAAMYGVPVVTLWGVTHPFTGFTPFNQPPENQITSDREQYPLVPTSVYGNKYPEEYEEVMKTISPSTILAKIQRILNK